MQKGGFKRGCNNKEKFKLKCKAGVMLGLIFRI